MIFVDIGEEQNWFKGIQWNQFRALFILLYFNPLISVFHKKNQTRVKNLVIVGSFSHYPKQNCINLVRKLWCMSSLSFENSTLRQCKIKHLLCVLFKHIWTFLHRNPSFLHSSKVFVTEAATRGSVRHWHSCFLVNVAKFQRKPFLQNTSGRLLLS